MQRKVLLSIIVLFSVFLISNVHAQNDTSSPVLTNPIPSNNTYIIRNSSYPFRITIEEVALNTSNVTLFYKLLAAPNYFNFPMSCSGSPTTYTCNKSITLLGFSQGDMIYYYYEASDNSSNVGRNGSITNPNVVIIDAYPPQWSNNTTMFFSPMVNLTFNITWTDDASGVNTILLEGNWSGSDTNYTMFNHTLTNFSYSIVLPSEDFYWKVYANDSLDQWNSTDKWNYTVNKSIPSFSTSVTTPITYGTASNYLGSETNEVDNECSYSLLRNGTEIATGSSVSDNTILSASSYNYTYYTNGCANVSGFILTIFTNGSDYNELTVNKATPTFTSSVTSPLYYISGGVASDYTASESDTGDSDCIYILLRDGTNIMNGSSVYDTSVLTNGYYNYTYYTNGCSNYTLESDERFLTVIGTIADETITPISATTTTTVPGGTTTTTIPNSPCSRNVNSLNDSSTSKNITFTGNENQTVYITIPKYYTVTNAQLNLSGYLNNAYKDIEDSYTNSSSSTWASGLEPPKCVDEIWTGLSGCECADGQKSWITENYTSTSNIYNITWNGEFESNSKVSSGWNCYVNISFWNYTKNAWSEVFNNLTDFNGAASDKYNMTFTVNASDFTGSNRDLSINLTLTDITNCYILYVESEVKFIVYPTNPYLDASGDGDIDWSYSGMFNQTNNRTSDFSSVINSILPSCSCDGCSFSGDNCTIPLVFHSDSSGILQISDINISTSLGLNIKAYDENSLEQIYFNYLISNSTYSIHGNDTWELSTTCENTPTGNLTIVISNSSYVDRYYYMTFYRTQNLDAYLLDKTSGVYITFLTVDSSNNPTSDVLVSARRYLNDSFVTVAQLKSDSQGKGWFFLYPWSLYKIQAEQDYVASLIDNYYPNSNYILAIKLSTTPSETYNVTYLLDDISYYLYPNTSYIDNTTRFDFYVSASQGDMEYYGLNLTWVHGWNSTVIYSGSDDSPFGGEIIVDVNLTALTLNQSDKGKILVTAFFKKIGYDLYTIKDDYIIWYEYSIFPDIIDSLMTGSLGLSPLVANLIALISTAGVSAGIKKKWSTVPMALPFLAILAIFVVGGLFTWYLYLILALLTIGIIIYQRVY